MALLEDADLKSALYASIAKQILDGLDTTHRDALLQKSIIEVVRDYSFRSAIEKVAAAKAAQVATKLMDSEEWVQQIEHVIREGFNDFLNQLRLAIPEAMKRTFHGKEGLYGGCGAVLQCWPKLIKDKEDKE